MTLSLRPSVPWRRLSRPMVEPGAVHQLPLGAASGDVQAWGGANEGPGVPSMGLPGAVQMEEGEVGDSRRAPDLCTSLFPVPSQHLRHIHHTGRLQLTTTEPSIHIHTLAHNSHSGSHSPDRRWIHIFPFLWYLYLYFLHTDLPSCQALCLFCDRGSSLLLIHVPSFSPPVTIPTSLNSIAANSHKKQSFKAHRKTS